jgi:hypothetical protein
MISITYRIYRRSGPKWVQYRRLIVPLGVNDASSSADDVPLCTDASTAGLTGRVAVNYIRCRFLH